MTGVQTCALPISLAVYGNPSALHTEGRAAREILQNARRTIARLTETKVDDIIFTSGATEANTLALVGSVRARAALGHSIKDMHILYLPTAHSSIVGSVAALGRIGVSVEPLSITPDGQVDLAELAHILRPETVLVVMDAVCGETGIIWNTRAVRHVLEKEAGENRPLLHIDASQAPYAVGITRSSLGADMFVLDAQKVGGVRGIGALIARRTIPIAPLTYGGVHERGTRPGTEPVALAAAFAAALDKAVSRRVHFIARAAHIREIFLDAIASIPQCVLNSGKDTVPHIVNISLLGRDTDYAVMLLDEEGFAVSTRSACEADADGSHAVFALTKDAERAAATLRISLGQSTKPKDFIRFARALRKAVAFLDATAI